jgi:hypothetical protein
MTKNLGFTCGRLDAKVYATIRTTGKKRGLKTNEVINRLVQTILAITEDPECLTSTGRETVERIMSNGT